MCLFLYSPLNVFFNNLLWTTNEGVGVIKYVLQVWLTEISSQRENMTDMSGTDVKEMVIYNKKKRHFEERW